MIQDAAVKVGIQQEWAVVIAQTKWSRSGILPGGISIQETPPEAFYNLPLVLAYSTLDHVLGQLLDERIFVCKSPAWKTRPNCYNLGDKLISAENAIPWIDFSLVKLGQDARNNVAHKNQMSDKATCLKYINAVGAELKGWGLL
jgi:hypothetical protein